MIPRADWPQRLNLGCGKRPHPEAINHDRYFFFAHVDHAWDLNHLPWPWPAGSFREVIAEDVLEHLDDVVKPEFLNGTFAEKFVPFPG